MGVRMRGGEGKGCARAISKVILQYLFSDKILFSSLMVFSSG